MPFNHIQKGVLEEIHNAHAGATEVMDLHAAQGLVAFFEKDEVGGPGAPTFTATSAKGINYKEFLSQLEGAISNNNNEAIVNSVVGAAVGFVFCTHGHGGVAQQDPQTLLAPPAKHRIPLDALKDPLEVLTGGLTDNIMTKLWAKATEGSGTTDIEGEEITPTVDRAGFVHFLRELRKKAMFTKPTILCDSIRTLRAKHGLPLAPQDRPGTGGGGGAQSLKSLSSSVMVAGRFGAHSRGGGGEDNFGSEVGSPGGADFGDISFGVSESAPNFGSGSPRILRQASLASGGVGQNFGGEGVGSPLGSLRKVQTSSPRGADGSQTSRAFRLSSTLSHQSAPPMMVELGVQTEDDTPMGATLVQEQTSMETQTSRAPTPHPAVHRTNQHAHVEPAAAAAGGSGDAGGEDSEGVDKEAFYKTLGIVEGQNQLLLQLRRKLYETSIARIDAQEEKLMLLYSDDDISTTSTMMPSSRRRAARGSEERKQSPQSFVTPSAPSPTRVLSSAKSQALSNLGVPPTQEQMHQAVPEQSRIAAPLSQVRVTAPPVSAHGHLSSYGVPTNPAGPAAAGDQLLEERRLQYEGTVRLNGDLDRYADVLRQWEHDIECKEEAARRLLDLRKREAMIKVYSQQEESARLDVSGPEYSNVILGAKEFAVATSHVYVETGGSDGIDCDGGESMITSLTAGGSSSVGGGRKKQWGGGGGSGRPAPSVIDPEAAAARRKRKASMIKEQQALRAAGANNSHTSPFGQSQSTPRSPTTGSGIRWSTRRELITPTAVERSLYPQDTPAPSRTPTIHAAALQQSDSALLGGSAQQTTAATAASLTASGRGGRGGRGGRDGTQGGIQHITQEYLHETFNDAGDAQLMHVLGHQWHPSFSN